MAFTLLWNKISPLHFLRNITLCTFTKISWILNRLLMEKKWLQMIFRLDWFGEFLVLESEKTYYAAVFLEQSVSQSISAALWWVRKAWQRLQSVLFSCISQLKKRGGATRQKKKKRLVVSITRSCIINSCPHAFFFSCSLALLEPMSLCMQPLGEHGELCTTSTVQSREQEGQCEGSLKQQRVPKKKEKHPDPDTPATLITLVSLLNHLRASAVHNIVLIQIERFIGPWHGC